MAKPLSRLAPLKQVERLEKRFRRIQKRLGVKPLPRRPRATGLEILEKRETEVKAAVAYVQGKKELEALGLTPGDIARLAGVAREVKPETLRRLQRLPEASDPLFRGALEAAERLRKQPGADPEAFQAALDLLEDMRRGGFGLKDLRRVRQAVEALRELRLDPAGFTTVVKSLAILNPPPPEEPGDPRERPPDLASLMRSLAREAERLRRQGVGPERLTVLLSDTLLEVHGLEGSLVELTRRKEAAGSALREREAQLARLDEEKGRLTVEVEAKRLEAHGKERELLGLAEQRRRLEEALRLAKSGVADLKTPAMESESYDAVFGKLKDVARAKAEVERELHEMDAKVKGEKAGELADILQKVHELNDVILDLQRRREALEQEIGRLAEQRRTLSEVVEPARLLWGLLSPEVTGPDFLDALDGFLRNAREGRLPPELTAQLTRENREALARVFRWLMEEHVVPRDELRHAEAQLDELREKTAAETVSKWRYEMELRERHALQKTLREETVPRWKYEALQDQVDFLTKQAFAGPADGLPEKARKVTASPR
ncbi:MAG: hypothetical protein HY558_08265 [Euryarchaeota archaeon]|nr:hypothetical protein [Euryarchaeota archaeon]